MSGKLAVTDLNDSPFSALDLPHVNGDLWHVQALRPTLDQRRDSRLLL